MKNETDLSKLELLSNLLSIWLNVLMQVRNFQKRWNIIAFWRDNNWELTNHKKELEHFIHSNNLKSIDKEIDELIKRKDKSKSDEIRNEYEKSIIEHKKQKDSYDKLVSQYELLGLREKSVISSLKRMQIDITRMKGISSSQEPFVISSIKEKSQELSEYLDDIKEGFKELEK